jgi:hypothetical protein
MMSLEVLQTSACHMTSLCEISTLLKVAVSGTTFYAFYDMREYLHPLPTISVKQILFNSAGFKLLALLSLCIGHILLLSL